MRTSVETKCHCGEILESEEHCAECRRYSCWELKVCPVTSARTCLGCTHALVGVDEVRCRLLDEVVLNERQAVDCGEYAP